jgi:cytochrome P450
MSYQSSLLDPDVVASPYPLYQRLRAEAPIFFDEGWNVRVVTRYDDVKSIQRDPRFSAIPPREPDWEPRRRILEILNANLLMFNDLPAHIRIRGLMEKAFDPLVPSMRDMIQQTVDNLLDVVQDKGEVDLFSDFSVPLPLTVQSAFVGVPVSDSGQLTQWLASTANFVFGTGYIPTAPADDQQVLDDLQSLVDYLRPLIEQRHQEPQNDLITALVQAEYQGDKLNQQELIVSAMVLTMGSFLSITVALSNCLVGLLQHPDQMQKLRDNPALIESAVEELLRYESQVQFSPRRAIEDVELHGQVIPKDQVVMIGIGSANRDESQFPNADQLDIRRANNRHLAFGGFGPHTCIAQALARIHLQTAVSTVVRRLKGLRLPTDNVVWLSPPIAPAFRSVGSLPVVFERR